MGRYGMPMERDRRITALCVLGGFLLLSFICIEIWNPTNATISPRVIRQRSVAAAGFVFSLCNSGVMIIMLYYLAIWFQVVKGVNALALLLSMTVAAMFAGFSVSKMGYYVPHIIAGPLLLSIGTGLMTTVKPDTKKGLWIRQVLVGFGFGVGMQQLSVAAQTVLAKEDVAVGSAFMMFGQQLSGSIFVPVAQAVFDSHLLSTLKRVEGIDPKMIIHAGADLSRTVPNDLIAAVLPAYNDSVTKVFMVAVVFSALAIIPALAIEWRSVKAGKKEKAKEKEEEVERARGAQEMQSLE